MDLVYELSADLTENLADLESRAGKILLVQKYMKQLVRENKAVPDLREGLEWFNVSQPLSLDAHLGSKLVLLDFFTYCCINCLHVLPEIKKLERKYTVQDGLVVIGVHSAKFEAEKVSKNVEAAVLRHEILHPVVNDGMVLWNQLQIACWPSLLLLGPGNVPLFILMGEGHTDTLDLMIEAGLDLFKDKISTSPVPQICPNTHLPPASGLLFPGRLTFLQGRLLIADSGHHRLLLVHGCDRHVLAKIGCGRSGLKDGSFKEACFFFPQGVVYMDPDTAFVADTENHAIRQIDFKRRMVTTVVGSGKMGTDRVGGTLPATKQALSSPWGLCWDQKKQLLFITMAGTHQIWAYAPNKDVTLWKKSLKKGECAAVAGSGKEENRNNSYPQVAAFAQPSGVALSGSKVDCLLIADSESSSIRKVGLDGGAVSGVVGGEKNPLNLFAFGDEDGKGTLAKLQHPLDVCWSDKLNSAAVVDTFNHKVKMVDLSSTSCTTIKTRPENSTDAGPNYFNLQLREPGGICSDESGQRFFIADTNNHLVRTLDFNTWVISEFPLLFATEVDSDGRFLQVVRKSVEISEENVSWVALSINVHFSGDMKAATEEALQTWHILFSGHSNLENLKGELVMEDEGRKLSASVEMDVSALTSGSQVVAVLKIVTCGDGQCKMESLKACLSFEKKPTAPPKTEVELSFEI